MCRPKPADSLKPRHNVYSKEQDIRLGQQAAQQVSRQVDVVKQQAPAVHRPRWRLTRATARTGGYPYEFTLINDPSINAFASPRGPIFVHSGLIAAADNEAQVADALANEIAQVALRHATSQASNLLRFPAALARRYSDKDLSGPSLDRRGSAFV